MTEYSHSRLSSFENCARAFRYRYIDKIEVETESIEAFTGKRVHEVLERLYHHVARWGRPPSLNQVLERFRKDWPVHWHEAVRIVRRENPREHYHAIGEGCLENYYRAHYPFNDGETIAIEEPIRLKLDPEGRYQLKGIVDRIVRRAEGHYEIHDYKTGGFVPRQPRIDADRQLALYQIGLEQTYKDVVEVDLIWHYVARKRTLRSRRTPESLVDLRRETIELIDRIEVEHEWKPTPGPLCRWCEYNHICDAAPAEARPEGARQEPPPLSELPTPPGETRMPPPPANPAPPPGGFQLSLLDWSPQEPDSVGAAAS